MTRVLGHQPASSSPFLRKRKIPQQNIVSKLLDRELLYCRPGTQFNKTRSLYTNIVPNLTVVNVEKPPCFLRKFSPDGRFFIAFSADQRAIEVYEFQGPDAAAHLLQDVKQDCYGFEGDMASVYIRTQLFEIFFKLKNRTEVARAGKHLNRECSLFTDDCRYLIVASAAFVPDPPHPLYHHVYAHNECIPPGTRFPIEHYTLHIINLETGVECDRFDFNFDKIALAHNQGLYLYNNTLAVLSMQKQTIHVFQITSDGRLVDLRTVGRFCHADDQLWIASVRDDRVDYAHREKTINSLKHRLLVYLYHKAVDMSKLENNLSPLLNFYKYFDQFEALRMWKMQLLDENHLLIRYTHEQLVGQQSTTDPNSAPSFFVVYCLATTKILSVFENTSGELLKLFERFSDYFRNATLQNNVQFLCSASSNMHAQEMHQRFKDTIVNAKFGGVTESIKRLLAQLPISAQSFSSSPYLDLNLYSYDDKWVSVMERPKTCGEHPIRSDFIDT